MSIVLPTLTDRTVWGLSRYQWLVVLAAWLGWGFDVFDALLFNYVARLCIPDLLHLPAGPEAEHTVNLWTGGLTSLLLVGWGCGGILFGKITDRVGRTRALLITMLTYSLGTAACAAAPNVWVLAVFRFIAALGIGGEWAAGAALVAETVPERRRVHAGAILYTASPLALFLATYVTDLFTRQLDFFAARPGLSWRLVFLTGLVPAAAALAIRFAVKEPPMWRTTRERTRLRDLFTPSLRRRTMGGLAISVMMLLAWWTCSAFLPRIAATLAQNAGLPLDEQARYVTVGTNWFNFGGLIGTLLTIPVAIRFGRRPLFLLYFAAAAVAILTAFGFEYAPETRLRLMFFVGLSVFGSFGALPFYLPELFPTHLRGTGSGFCYNFGRFIAAAGPFAVPALARAAGTDLRHIVSWAAVFPLIGIVVMRAGFGHETRDAKLE